MSGPRVAYLDASVPVAIAAGEPAAGSLSWRLEEFDRIVSSNLLEAEVRSVCVRLGQPFSPDDVSGIRWVFPQRSLAPEFEKVLSAGYLRGGDLLHVATALHVASSPESVWFVTLDRKQGAVAEALGFQTLDSAP